MNHLRWPLHPQPHSEESLLSWLTRIAKCYDFTLDELLQHDLGFQGDLRDLNMNAPDWLLSLLSKRTGVSEETIRALTVLSWVPLLLDDLTAQEVDFGFYVNHYSLLLPSHKRKKPQPKSPWKPWVGTLPFTISKACPLCLKDKQVSILYLVWYLPLMLSCPVHKCLLQQCHISYPGYPIYFINENAAPIFAPAAIHVMDQRTWSALTTGQVALPHRTIHGGVWLRLLRTLLNELHLPISSMGPAHVKDIAGIWTSLGLNFRCGMANWKPYEVLPAKIQEQTLMASATAMAKIENRLISPPGGHCFLFLPEPTYTKDLPSHQENTGAKETFSGPPLKKETDLINQFIEMAKRDPVAAKDLRRSALFGRTDLKVVQEVENLLIDVGIPPQFLQG
ncbi:MAG: transposase [Gammaproteobacteria bacterium]|jgi:hypothetical protein|nr:transposase [Gammaproteobacteria bacterium]